MLFIAILATAMIVFNFGLNMLIAYNENWFDLIWVLFEFSITAFPIFAIWVLCLRF